MLDGAVRARGVAVIIDVFRAFSLAPYAFMQGAATLFPVGTPEEALAMKAADPALLLAGERDGRPLPGFDYSNSPAAMRRADLAGRRLALRTSAGIQGLLAAGQAEEVITGSFVNAPAIIAWLRNRAPPRISLVCMGWNGSERTAEDEACAEFLTAGLRGEAPDLEPIRRRLRADPSGAKFFDPARPWFPAEDFDACLQLSAWPFVLRRGRDEKGRLCLAPVPVPETARISGERYSGEDLPAPGALTGKRDEETGKQE
nr:2-phosphosulfolactate phosphatase [Wenzhouxiangella sp. XN24]